MQRSRTGETCAGMNGRTPSTCVASWCRGYLLQDVHKKHQKAQQHRGVLSALDRRRLKHRILVIQASGNNSLVTFKTGMCMFPIKINRMIVIN